LKRLLEGDAWVVITFEDGTKQCIHTTLCKERFKQLFVEPRENHFYDLEHNKFIPFRTDAKDIEVFDEKPVFDSEVLSFASRFI
jgi:hypothetical protein